MAITTTVAAARWEAERLDDRVMGSNPKNIGSVFHFTCAVEIARKHAIGEILQIGEHNAECRKIIARERAWPRFWRWRYELDVPTHQRHTAGEQTAVVEAPFTHLIPFVRQT